MIFKQNKHNSTLYSTLLYLSRNILFYKDIGLKDNFESRLYLMLIHFALILNIFKTKKIIFPQDSYDSLFHSIENNLRELGLGDVNVNKKMKQINKILYDILLKINISEKKFKVNKFLVLKYFNELNKNNNEKYMIFDEYLVKFYHFCFEQSPKNMIKDAINFKD